jgi:hypothetical protein
MNYFDCNISNSTNTVVHFDERRQFMDVSKVVHNLIYVTPLLVVRSSKGIV